MEKILKCQYVMCDKPVLMKRKKNAGAATPELMALLETADEICLPADNKNSLNLAKLFLYGCFILTNS
jgi:hypothetical protein